MFLPASSLSTTRLWPMTFLPFLWLLCLSPALLPVNSTWGVAIGAGVFVDAAFSEGLDCFEANFDNGFESSFYFSFPFSFSFCLGLYFSNTFSVSPSLESKSPSESAKLFHLASDLGNQKYLGSSSGSYTVRNFLTLHSCDFFWLLWRRHRTYRCRRCGITVSWCNGPWIQCCCSGSDSSGYCDCGL